MNLSLGTTNLQHERALAAVIADLRASGAVMVAAGLQNGVAWLPGTLPGAWN